VPHPFAFCAKGWAAQTPIPGPNPQDIQVRRSHPCKRTQEWGNLRRGGIKRSKGRATRQAAHFFVSQHVSGEFECSCLFATIIVRRLSVCPKVIDMRRAIFLTMLIFVIAEGARAAQQSAPPASPVWQWFQNCADKTTMGIRVRVDGKSVFKSSFPICKTANAPHSDGDGKQKTLVFTFRCARKFQGEYQTSNAEMIEGNIWQAGADADDLLLGISFVSKKQNQILLNTTQIARPTSRSAEEVDTGIFVETFRGGKRSRVPHPFAFCAKG
jgi:hypothetical protein